MRVKINSTEEIKEVKQVGDKLFDKENNCYLLGQVTVLEEWYSASKLPELNEYGNSELVYALYGTNNSRLSPIISCVIEGKWHDDNIKWWCYPPTNL